MHKNQDTDSKNIISILIFDISQKNTSFLFIPNKINP